MSYPFVTDDPGEPATEVVMSTRPAQARPGTRHRWLAAIGLTAVLSAVPACGGGGGGPSPPSVAQSTVLDPQSRDYFLALFTHTAKTVSLDMSPDVHAGVRALAEDSMDRPRAEALYGRLRAALPTRRIRWKSGQASFAGGKGSEPLVLTRGLERAILIEVENRAPHSRPFVVYMTDPRESNEVSTPPGERRGVLTTVSVDDASATHVELFVQSDFVRDTVHLPVRVVEPATISGSVRDLDTGLEAPARVSVRSSDGQWRHDADLGLVSTLTLKKLAPGALQLLYRVPFFYSDGTFRIDVPPGETALTMERGIEYDLARETLSLVSGEVRDVTLAAGRFFDMRSRGWISGDTHVHWVRNTWYENEDLEILSTVQQAEDVQVVNNLVARQLSQALGWEFVKPDQAPMGPVPGLDTGEYLVQMGEEYRNDPFYGHLVFLNLAGDGTTRLGLVQPVSTGDPLGPFAEDYPTNLTAIDTALAHQPSSSRPIVISAHGIAGSGYADVALGRTDSFDQMVPSEYYRLLDAGLRVPLTTGSDHPERIVGQARCYVKIQPPLAYGAWVDGILAGATFTTSGPLLLLSIDGQDVGSELDVARGETVSVHVEVHSRHPIGRVEIVSNSEVLHVHETDATSTVIDFPWTADGSRWIVARCSNADTPTWRPLIEPDSAHTSAIYLTVDGEPFARDVHALESLRDICQTGGDFVYASGTFHGPDAELKRQEARAYLHAGRDAYQALLDAVR